MVIVRRVRISRSQQHAAWQLFQDPGDVHAPHIHTPYVMRAFCCETLKNRTLIYPRILIRHHMTEAKKNWAESRQLRVGAMLPTAQRRPDLRIAGEDQSGALPGGGSTQNRS